MFNCINIFYKKKFQCLTHCSVQTNYVLSIMKQFEQWKYPQYAQKNHITSEFIIKAGMASINGPVGLSSPTLSMSKRRQKEV